MLLQHNNVLKVFMTKYSSSAIIKDFFITSPIFYVNACKFNVSFNLTYNNMILNF